MQNQSPFSTPPPIPTPDGNFSPFKSETMMNRNDWKTAPVIVKGWSYPLMWLLMVLLGVGVLAGLVALGNNPALGAFLLALFNSAVRRSDFS